MKKLLFLAAAFVVTTWLGGMNTMYCTGSNTGYNIEKSTNAPGVLGVDVITNSENLDSDFKCIDHKWKFTYLECTEIDGKPAYCFKLVVYNAKECEKFKYSVNENMAPGYPAWTYDNQGNLIIKGCFWANNANNPLCVKIDFLSPLCCDIVACAKLPCCYKKEWKGKAKCDRIDGKPVYCYSIKLYDVKPCGKFTITTDGTPVAPPTIVYDILGNATINGCVWTSSLPINATQLCFKVDFKDPHCCDIKGCIKLPCCEQKWKGELKCTHINGQQVICYTIVVAGAKDCGGLDFGVEGTSVNGPNIVYNALNGNATITGCVLASSLPPGASELCFKVDFKSPQCCDFKGCLKLPPDCCKEKSYGFETYECHVVDGKKIICFVFVVKEAKECDKFNYTVNATTVEGPAYSYDANGNLYIKHCVTKVEGHELCIKIDWLSDLCCDINQCYPLPECVGFSPQIKARSQLSEEEANEMMSIRPVPADEYLHVELGEGGLPGVIIVTDLNQKEVVRVAPLNRDATIYTGGLANGLYVVSLYDLSGKRLSVQKVQILHK